MEVSKRGTEEEISGFIQKGYEYTHGKGALAKDFIQAEINFNEAARIDYTGRSHFILGQFLLIENRKPESLQAMKLAADAGFQPGFIWQIQDKCNRSWYGKLDEKELARLKKAGDEGYIKARIYWLSNNKDILLREAVPKALEARRLKADLRKKQKNGEYRKNELYW